MVSHRTNGNDWNGNGIDSSLFFCCCFAEFGKAERAESVVVCERENKMKKIGIEQAKNRRWEARVDTKMHQLMISTVDCLHSTMCKWVCFESHCVPNDHIFIYHEMCTEIQCGGMIKLIKQILPFKPKTAQPNRRPHSLSMH